MAWPREIIKQRWDISKFAALIASPVTGPFQVPGNAVQMMFVSVAGCAAGTTAATIVSSKTRTIGTPVLAAGQNVTIDYVERDAMVTPEHGFNVYINVGLDIFKKIAQGA